jgi:hypothetical protein
MDVASARGRASEQRRGGGPADRLCVGSAAIRHTVVPALQSAISAIAAAVTDELSLPVPAWPVLSGCGSVAADIDVAPLVLAAEQRLANDCGDHHVGSSTGRVLLCRALQK